MRDDDDDRDWWKPVLIGLGALLGVSLLVGGLIGVLALGAASVAGLGGSGVSGPSAAPSLYMPALSPTSTQPEPSIPTSGTVQPAPSKTSKPKTESRISLTAYPRTVSSLERINLTGVYPRGEGAVLQVQRFENGWVDFPTTATVRGGIFTTYVMTGRVGDNRFRMLDTSSGRKSNPVTITVG